MTSSPGLDDVLRKAIIDSPDVILDDPDVMNALVAANDRMMGENVVDMRGIAMKRLEYRLNRLEDTHRSVIAAAYENMAGTSQVHRAILELMEPMSFNEFLTAVNDPVAQTLRVDTVRLVLEARHRTGMEALEAFRDVLKIVQPGFINGFVMADHNRDPGDVVLRQLVSGNGVVYGEDAPKIRSEACIRLDFGGNALPGLLVLGSENEQLFSPQQGTDLLSFFGGVFERIMRRWLG